MEHRTIGGRPADIERRRDGHIAHIHSGNMDIRRGVRGDRRVERFDGHGGRVVAYGRGRGFYERRYIARGSHVYIQRTYVFGGRRYAYAYRSYSWHGVAYYRYAPAFYFHPAFYVWVGHPWAAPVYYAWAPAPWFGFYGYYFAPAPFYPTPALWVTDYVLAANLSAAYAAQQPDPGAPPAPNDGGQAPPQASNGPVVLSPEVKAAIAQEVQAQLQAQQQAAAAPPQANPTDSSDNVPPPALDPNQRTFVVGSSVDVTGADGSDCRLSSGDVLYRNSDPNGNNVDVLVQASQKGDCKIASTVSIDVAELQEMHNQFCQQIDAGLQKLAAEQGKNGVPAAPDTGAIAGEVPPPAPDNAATDQVQSAQTEADQDEQQAAQPAAGGSGGSH